MPSRFKFRAYVDDIGIINDVGIVGNEVMIDKSHRIKVVGNTYENPIGQVILEDE